METLQRLRESVGLMFIVTVEGDESTVNEEDDDDW